jgi:hypothetical protein
LATPGDSTSPDEVGWTCHPVRLRPVAGVLAAIFVVAVVWGVHLWLGVAIITAIAALILVLSVLPFYVPTHYRLTEEEIEVRGIVSKKTVPWSKYRSLYTDARGALLTPFTRPSRLDRLVGLNLRFDAPDRERVVAALKRKLDEKVAHAGA